LHDDDLLSNDLMVQGERQMEGVGVIEAPRGTLFHHYQVDENDIVTMANLIVSTTNNNQAMNEAVRHVARRYLNGREITEGLLAAYTAKTGRSRDEIAAMLDAETYMSAQKCVDLGFADGILYQEDGDGEKEKQPAASVMMQGKQHGRAAALARVQPSLAELNRRAEIIRRAKIIGETIR